MVEKVHTYDLPDLEIINSDTSTDSFLWKPDNSYLILGRSNNIKSSVNISHLKLSPIKVYQRPSGGEAVLISPKTLIISVKINRNGKTPHSYFRIINSKIINHLKSVGIKNLYHKGISDITIGNKKILGSSIYSSNNIVFYHAVLNVCESITNIASYLKHPGREPDYRMGKKHEDFVTSIKQEGYDFSVDFLQKIIKPGLQGLS